VARKARKKPARTPISRGTDGHNSGTGVAAERELESSNGPPTLRGEEESFFRAGDEGRYEGGPATRYDEDLELDEPLRPVIIRTPEMDARRARYVRFVSASLGGLIALFAIGLVRRTANADSSSHREPAGVVVATPLPAALAPESDQHALLPVAVAKPSEAPVPKPIAAEPVKPSKPLTARAMTAAVVSKTVSTLAPTPPPAAPAPPPPASKPAVASFPIAR
jgi:hypothetical protein